MTDDRTRPDPEDEHTLSISDVEADEEATLDGTPSGPIADDPQMPGSIGGFRIIGKLGEGGMGTVWEAEQAQPKRRVALKVMRRDHIVDELHAKMFRREAESLARLRHPNIAAIYESGHTEDGHDFFAMELVLGVTLDVWLAGRPTTVDAAELELRLGLFRSICDAVHYAHQRGVIHRDLKPTNIIVTDDDVSSDARTSAKPSLGIKILDFGLARITDADIAATMISEIGVIKGTLQYMSPEQARGDVAAIDVRSDVYALGVILYEMLTGRRPYNVTRAALAEAVRVICEDTPDPVTKSWSGVRKLDTDLETIVGKTLEKEADRRYDSAAALREDIDRYLGSQPILARAPSAAYQLRKMVQRNRLGAAFAATVLALVVVLAVTMTVQAGRIARERDRAETEAAKALAVNQFMRETLGAANPYAQGVDITVLEALDQAVGRIETSFADQPAVEAEIRQTIGDTYNALGRFDEAEPLLETALVIRTELFGRDSAEAIESMASLAQVAWRRPDYDLALVRGEELLDARRRVFGDPSSHVAVTLDFIGRLLVDASRFEEADETMKKALAMSLEVHGESSIQVAACYQNMSVLEEVWRQDYVKAEELTRKEIEIRRAVEGGDTMETASSINNLGIHLMYQGRFEEAAASIEEANAIIRRLGGDRHPELAKGLENLGNVYYRLGQTDKTLELLAEVIEMRRAVLGDDSPQVARGLTNLGAVYRITGQFERAEETLRDAVARMERAYGPDHVDVASAHRSLGLTLWSLKKADEAEAELRTAHRIAEAAYEEGTLGLAGYQNYLGRVLGHMGKYTEAEALLIASYDAHVAAHGADSEITAGAAAGLAELYEAWGRPDQAARYRPE
jgi:tetratricopeptide (TPR) repeat protein/tRNA A-37 threonylcarbamoyl transferase component Bud32